MGLFSPRTRVARRDIQDAIGIDEESNFNPSESGRHGRNVPKFKTRQTSAILHELAFTLQDVDQNVGLPHPRQW